MNRSCFLFLTAFRSPCNPWDMRLPLCVGSPAAIPTLPFASVSGAGEAGQRRFYPVEEKHRLVEQALEAGASVAQVARENGVNANLLLLWRRQHREGRLLPVRTPLFSIIQGKILSARMEGVSRTTIPSIHTHQLTTQR